LASCSGYAVPFGSVIQILILTGTRQSELLEAEWSELDLGGRMWRIPRACSKTDVAHLVPPSGLACGIIEGPRIGNPPSALLFTTAGSAPFSGVPKVHNRIKKSAAKYIQPRTFRP
jgi:integrase